MHKQNMEILMASTPFSRWLENGEDQPYGGDYENEAPYAQYSSEDIALNLIDTSFNMSKIMSVIIAKERLRWLSRKLYRIVDDHKPYNEKRATMVNGHMTDDELANAFFLSESKNDLRAGHDRIMWLVSEINKRGA